MNPTKTLLLLVWLFLSPQLFSQQIKILDFSSPETDISAREFPVLDVNNEACAIIKVRTGLVDVEFESNRGIDSIQQKKGEYWIWTSPGTSILKIIIPDFPLFEYELPETTSSYDVYVITVVAILPTRIEYRDREESYISFDTKPEGAQVFLNDMYQGVTPIKINIPAGPYSYRLEKERYVTITRTDSLYSKSKGHNYTMEYDFRKRSFFVSPVLGIASPKGGRPFGPEDSRFNYSFGITLGQIGKTSWYFSAMTYYKAVEPDFVYYPGSHIYYPFVDISGSYYFSDMAYDDLINHISLSAGVTRQLTNSLFIYAGVGYYQRKCYAMAEKRNYGVDYSLEEEGLPLYDEAWIYMLKDSFIGANLEAGLMFRIAKHYMGHFGISNHLWIESGVYPGSFDYVIGLGYNF